MRLCDAANLLRPRLEMWDLRFASNRLGGGRILNKKLSKRGVSVIIGALLLIAIAVGAAVLLYVYSIGIMGNMETSGGTQMKDSLIVESYNWNTVSVLVLNVRNVGATVLNMLQADYFVNGVASTFAATCTATLQPQASCIISLTVPGTITNGEAYPVKIVVSDGAVFAYSAVCGESG